jgi:hypothetical protein
MANLLQALVPIVMISLYLFLIIKCLIHNNTINQKHRLIWNIVILFLSFGPFVYFFVVYSKE